MYQLRLFKLTLIPSILSAFATLLGSALSLGLLNWSQIKHVPVLYNYFFGPQGLIAILHNGPNHYSNFANALFSKTISYNVVVFAASIAIGLVIYITLQGSDRILGHGASAYLRIQNASNPLSKQSEERDLRLRILIRCLIFTAWCGYWLISIKILLPYAVYNVHLGIQNIALPDDWLHIVSGYAILVVTIHIHVIFMRLFILRPRLFGGNNAINIALHNKN